MSFIVHGKISTDLVVPVYTGNRKTPLRAIVDTGTHTSLISLKLAKRLALPSVDKVKIRFPGQEEQRALCRHLVFWFRNEPQIVLSLQCAEIATTLDDDFDLLLGLDFLEQFKLTADGPAKKFTIKRA